MFPLVSDPSQPTVSWILKNFQHSVRINTCTFGLPLKKFFFYFCFNKLALCEVFLTWRFKYTTDYINSPLPSIPNAGPADHTPFVSTSHGRKWLCCSKISLSFHVYPVTNILSHKGQFLVFFQKCDQRYNEWLKMTAFCFFSWTTISL